MTMRIVKGADAIRRDLISRDIELATISEQDRCRASEVFGEDLSPREFVGRVMAQVRDDGDEALRRIGGKLGDYLPERLELSCDDLATARAKAPTGLETDLKLAAERIRSFHQRQMPKNFFDKSAGLGQRWIAVGRAGLHIPSATGPLASSLLMTAIPARVAGVDEVIVCTGVTDEGIAPTIAVAAHLAEVDRVIAVSGAQAIMAMALGTVSVPKCDAIVAPGNAWVMLATREVFGLTGVSVLAGPTETLVIADLSADPAEVAADLIAQAEHGGPASPIVLTDDLALANQIASHVQEQLISLPKRETATESFSIRGGIGVVADLEEAIGISNEYGPEHLCLHVSEPDHLLGDVRNAGGVFIGSASPEVHGDYIAGPSHVMPTGGTARFSSPCGVHTFLKSMSLVQLGAEDSRQLAPIAARIARSEGLEGHARAAERRWSESHE